MTKYKFKGYTITNCGYHQPDHCVWWEAVDENGEACFHGNTLREVEFMILDYEWEQKMRKKEEEIELLKASKPSGNLAAMREALMKIWKEVYFYAFDEEKQDFPHLQEAMLEDPPDYKSLRNSFFEIAHLVDAALAEPPRNCDRFRTDKDAWEYMRQRHPKWTVFEYISWLFAPAEEGGAK